MKISIIGAAGIVGGAHLEAFRRLGHGVVGYDIRPAQEIGVTDRFAAVLDTDICFICVPTPLNSFSNCDTRIVESVIDSLFANDYQGFICIKSTIIPGTTDRIINRHKDRSDAGLFRIAYSAEFLKERSAFHCLTENHNLLVIGSHEPENIKGGINDAIKEAYGHYPKQAMVMRPVEAELLKYFWNTFAALRVVFANSIYEISKTLGANYDVVKNAFLANGPQINQYLDVNDSFRAYAGPCLVKDTLALEGFVKSMKLNLKLFETIDSENNKFTKTVWPNMRQE
jgi:nucleotide sugar dehydrogenase